MTDVYETVEGLVPTQAAEIARASPADCSKARDEPLPPPGWKLIYSVIKSHEPAFEYEIWLPVQNRFMDMTLGQIVLEIPKSRPATEMTSLVFTLEIPGRPIICKIVKSDEQGFRMLKARFDRHIQKSVTEATERPLELEMTIQPVYKVEGTSGVSFVSRDVL